LTKGGGGGGDSQVNKIEVVCDANSTSWRRNIACCKAMFDWQGRRRGPLIAVLESYKGLVGASGRIQHSKGLCTWFPPRCLLEGGQRGRDPEHSVSQSPRPRLVCLQCSTRRCSSCRWRGWPRPTRRRCQPSWGRSTPAGGTPPCSAACRAPLTGCTH